MGATSGADRHLRKDFGNVRSFGRVCAQPGCYHSRNRGAGGGRGTPADRRCWCARFGQIDPCRGDCHPPCRTRKRSSSHADGRVSPRQSVARAARAVAPQGCARDVRLRRVHRYPAPRARRRRRGDPGVRPIAGNRHRRGGRDRCRNPDRGGRGQLPVSRRRPLARSYAHMGLVGIPRGAAGGT